MTSDAPLPLTPATPTTLVVVGFPKSGNTWLTRLLADALNAPVLDRWLDGHIEFASDVNRHLREPHHPSVRVAKLHDLPEVFAQRGIDGPMRFVYVHRDPRDVAVSAFFHFTKWQDATVRSLLQSRSLGPWGTWQRGRVRRAIRSFVRRFATRGIARLEQRIGRWDRHVRAWITAEHPIIPVSYEELLADTPRTLGRVTAALQLPGCGTADVAGAAARQAFGAVKRSFEQADGDDAIPLGRDFGMRFMRRGAIGDWRTFLERDEVDLIRARFAEVFNQLGYNRDWRDAAVVERLEAAA